MDKSWYKSLTVWATIAFAVLTAAHESVAAIGGDVAAKAGPIIAAVLAIVGRFRATGPLTLR
jgi:hypothetical protein